MILTPDRLADLRARLEAGESISQADLERLSTLQAIDIACVGREFLIDALELQEAEDGKLAARLGLGNGT